MNNFEKRMNNLRKHEAYGYFYLVPMFTLFFITIFSLALFPEVLSKAEGETFNAPLLFIFISLGVIVILGVIALLEIQWNLNPLTIKELKELREEFNQNNNNYPTYVVILVSNSNVVNPPNDYKKKGGVYTVVLFNREKASLLTYFNGRIFSNLIEQEDIYITDLPYKYKQSKNKYRIITDKKYRIEYIFKPKANVNFIHRFEKNEDATNQFIKLFISKLEETK